VIHNHPERRVKNPPMLKIKILATVNKEGFQQLNLYRVLRKEN
jgi:hypothetical protein